MAGVHHRGGACVWREPCVARPVPFPFHGKQFSSRPWREKQKPERCYAGHRREWGRGWFDEVRRKLKQISNLSGLAAGSSRRDEGKENGEEKEWVRGSKSVGKPDAKEGASRRELRAKGDENVGEEVNDDDDDGSVRSFVSRVWITSSSSPDWKWKPPNGRNDIKPVTMLKFSPLGPTKSLSLSPSLSLFRPSTFPTFLCYLVDWFDSNYRQTRTNCTSRFSSLSQGRG